MKKIFLLEDEETIGRIYTKRLISAGFNVQWGKSVAEAKRMLKNFAADCVLIDHGIYGESESGLDAVDFLKKNLPKAKLIMLSNYSSQDLAEQAKRMGIDDYLVKLNYPPKLLIDYLSRLLA